MEPINMIMIYYWNKKLKKKKKKKKRLEADIITIKKKQHWFDVSSSKDLFPNDCHCANLNNK